MDQQKLLIAAALKLNVRSSKSGLRTWGNQLKGDKTNGICFVLVAIKYSEFLILL